ncbi:MAG: response regulator [Gammaproteobacteria bacterium]|nr:response regulator [Gammaproteobacteria bacterium]
MPKILIIDDTPDSLELIRYLFVTQGYDILVAEDGQKGFEMALREVPDLIVTDIRMPKMSGFDLIKKILETPSLSDVPCIAITAQAMKGSHDKILSAGFKMCLEKPVDPERLLAQVESFLKNRIKKSQDTVTEDAKTDLKAPSLNKLVLVIDNSPDNLELSRMLLEYDGYQVLTATGVREALVVARKMPPDLFLSDVHMPDGDGYELIREVKKDSTLCHIPFVFITASSWKYKDFSKGLTMGAVNFIIRPIEPKDFLQSIKGCFEKKTKLGEEDGP